MGEGNRFPQGLPRTSGLLLIWAVVVACCIALYFRRMARIVMQQMTAWTSRAGS